MLHLPTLLLCAVTVAVAASAADSGELLRYRSTWVGNSLPGAGTVVQVQANRAWTRRWVGMRWVQMEARSLHVSGDGTCHVAGYTESGPDFALYRHGQPIQLVGDIPKTAVVTTSVRYLFAAMPSSDTASGETLLVVRRYFRGTLEPAPFAGGVGAFGSELVAARHASGEVPRTGLGLAVVGGTLVVGDPLAGELLTFDAEAPAAPLARWPATRPGRIAADGAGGVWVVRRADEGGGGVVVRYTLTGELRPQTVAVADPVAVAVDADGRLLVADRATDVVRIYADATTAPAPAATIGPEPTLTFLTGVGADAAGNVYVSAAGIDINAGHHAVLACYDRSLRRTWQAEGLIFQDIPDVDPATLDGDQIVLWTPQEKIRLDLGQPPGSDATFLTGTVDRRAFPDDVRLHHGDADSVWDAQLVHARRIAGRLFLFMVDQNSRWLAVYRFDAAHGDTAIPCAFHRKWQRATDLWPPNRPTGNDGEWLWVDRDGDGQCDAGEFSQRSYPYRDPAVIGAATPRSPGLHIDTAGGLWLCNDTASSLSYFPASVAANGVLGYDYGTAQVWETESLAPEVFNWPDRSHYDPATDRLVLAARLWPEGDMTRLLRFDGWLASGGTAAPTWSRTLPRDDTELQRHIFAERAMSMTVAGDHVFVGYVVAGETEVRIYRLVDGAQVGKVGPSLLVSREGSPMVESVGLLDSPDPVRAHRRADGEYLIWRGDNMQSGTAIVYRWHPDRRPPAAPPGLVAGHAGDGAVTLSWNAAADATTSTVERRPHLGAAGWGAWQEVASGIAGTAWTDPTSGPNTLYWYRVRGVNGDGPGDVSTTVAAMRRGAVGVGAWARADVGAVAPMGLSTVDAATGEVVIEAAGAGFGRVADAFHHLHRPVSGDVDLTIRLDSSHFVGGGQRAGLMLRAGPDPGADHIAVMAGSGGIAVHQRIGGRLWRRCVKQVDTDAIKEAPGDTLQRIDLGLIYPYNGSTATVWVDGARIVRAGTTENLLPDGGFEAAATGAFPAGWNATAGTWVVTDQVSLFGSRCLEGRYESASPQGPSRQVAVSGDGIFTVGFYAATDTDSETAALVRSPRVHVWFRRADGSSYQIITTDITPGAGAGVRPPCHLRLRRAGGMVTASFSLDGTTFTDLDEPLTVAFPDQALIGIAAASGHGAVTGYVRARIPIDEVNLAPTVERAASASPSPTTGITTTLSVLGADDGGEAALTYHWEIEGAPPAAVVLAANGSNAAKSTTATFFRVGSYRFRCTIRDADGLTATSAVAVTVQPSPTGIRVAP